jgi:hypothetical protein
MTNGQVSSIDARKKRWNDFMVMDGENRFMVVVDFEGNIPPRPPLWPDKKRERIDWVIKRYEDLSQRAQWLNDDMIPHIDMLTGTEIFAEAFGCKVYRPEGEMPFARPLVHNAAEAIKLKIPEVENSSLSQLFEIADGIKAATGGNGVMRLPDIQSPMDIAALIWDKNDFYAALLEEPEAVKELAGKVLSLLTAFLDKWFDRYGHDFIAHFPFYYMASGLTLSEDECGSVSPGIFKEFFLPELSLLSQRYGCLGMHCCADSRHQWDHFLQIPNLKFLNLIQPGEIVNEAVTFFAGHLAQDHSEVVNRSKKERYFKGRPAWEWPKMVPNGVHMVLHAAVSTREEAIDMCNRFNDACGRA